MNKLALSSAIGIIAVFGITSCNKDVTEADLLKNQLATADSLLKRGGIIKYTVKIVSTANSSILKSKMSIENAEVTIFQNDSTYTANTDANGFAVFPNMRIGTAAVNIKLKDHAEVDYVADLTPADNLLNLSTTQVINTVRYASTLVPMFPIADPGAATITGKVTAELDLTNTAPEPVPGATVTAQVDVDDSTFVDRYIKPTQGTTNSNAGRIVKFAFQDGLVSAQTDATGTYTLKVPAALNGLPIKLSVNDFQGTQKLYLENDPSTGTFSPSAYNVSTIFSSSYPANSIPTVQPVYLIVDEPSCPFGKVSLGATFSYQIDANGSITKVSVLTKGNYSSKPGLVAIYNGTGAILDPVFNPTTGGIDTVKIVNGGTGYKADGAGTYIRAFLAQEHRFAKITGDITSSGGLSKVTLVDKGAGYITNPAVTIYTLNTSAVKPSLLLECYPFSQEIRTVTITNPGSNLTSTGNTPSVPLNYAANKKLTANSSLTIIQNLYLGTGYKTN